MGEVERTIDHVPWYGLYPSSGIEAQRAKGSMGTSQPMTIGGLAKAAGVNVETIRYYQRRGLIPEPGKPAGGHRRYSPAALERVHFIRRAQQLGFTLDEVKGLLDLSTGKNCREVQKMAERKLTVIESRLAELSRIRRRLRQLVAACEANPHRDRCPIIAALNAGH